MSDDQDRILKMVEEGTLSAAEANDMLEALETEEATAVPGPVPSPKPETLHRPWQIPVAGGLVLLTAGALGLAQLARRPRSGPLGPVARVGAAGAFFLGALLTALGLWSRNAVWLHVRVEEKGSPSVNVSLPLPLGLAERAVTLAREQADEETAAHLDAAAAFLASVRSGGEREPFTVEVSEGEETRVFVYVG